MAIPSFAEVLTKHDWRPIPNCPGRYVLSPSPSKLTVGELVGDVVPTDRHETDSARDPVLVSPLADGGLISYERHDGGLVHTLCDEDGMVRKLRQLGLPLPQ